MAVMRPTTTWMKSSLVALSRSLLLMILLTHSTSITVHAEGETKQMLDDMAKFWGRDKGYPDNIYDELEACFSKWDEPVLEAQDASWRQFYDLYITGGFDSSTKWDALDPLFLENKQNKSAFFGGHPNSIGTDDTGPVAYEIIERCNYVSNGAYYNSVLRTCRRVDSNKWNVPSDIQSALMKSIATTAVASFLFHGSMTGLFLQWDVNMGAILAYNGYQILTQSVEINSTIFRTASNSVDPISIVELTDRATFFPLELPVDLWSAHLSLLPVPPREQVAAGLVSFYCVVILPFGICESILNEDVANSLLSQEAAEFYLNEYLPELKMVAQQEDLPLPLWQSLQLAPKIIGGIAAFFWAFAFLEDGLVDTPDLEGPIFNTTCLAAFSNPVVNLILDTMIGVGNPTKDIYNQKEEYPGAKFCNRDSPHAFWHQLSADALFENTVLADEINKILQERKERRQSGWSVGSIVSGFQNLRGGRGDD